MAASVNDFKIVTPFMPSLSHVTVVSEAIILFKKFSPETLDNAFKEIQQSNATESYEWRQDCEENYERARRCLLFIPSLLRTEVLQAVHALEYELMEWRLHLERFFDLRLNDIQGNIICWRSEGTIDRVKTAQRLVLNTCINISKRFNIACMYCFEKSIQTLWTEMGANGERENFRINNPIIRFWVRWLQDRSRINWIEDLRKYLTLKDTSRKRLQSVPIRFSAFFPLLEPEDRKKFILPIKSAVLDDLRLDFYSMNNEEENELMSKIDITRVFLLYLNWPLQKMFLETAEKLWSFLRVGSYNALALVILYLIETKKDFDYSGLFLSFWKMTPKHLKKGVKQWPWLSKSIDSFLKKTMKKGKGRKRNADDEQPNGKKRTRKNGRLQST